MKFKDYLYDYLFFLIFTIILTILIYLILYAFKTPLEAIIVICCIHLFTVVFFFIYDFIRKKKFYDTLFFHIQSLDEAYLVLETIKQPTFLEGRLLYNALYDINKSMRENVKALENQNIDFKEYLELWIHEIKIPVSSLLLMFHNHKDIYDERAKKQMQSINNYLEQILYYERSEISTHDYLIKEIKLMDIIHMVALKNMDILLEKDISLEVYCENEIIVSDAKWLEYIINQIINNSIKYMNDKNEKIIKIKTRKVENILQLMIEDNGIGIPSDDLPKVFDKSFTGYNGRLLKSSTGMGLYICKNLCTKLGHKLMIDSKADQGTIVTIEFNHNDYYQIIK